MSIRSTFRLCLLVIASLACGCGQKKETAQDETAIRNASQAYVKAINSQDIDTLSSLWTDDAILVNFTRRETIQGKSEIANYLKEQFQRDNNPRLEARIDSISFEGSGKAIEKGTVSVSTATDGPREFVFQAEYVKNNQSWLLQKLTQIELIPSPSHYEYLKELNWLVGNWSDEDSGTISTKSAYEWDANKNFLIQKFTSTVLDKKELTGSQIIGWDPIKNTIFSWIFDSDGGFGKSTWINQGNSWYATLSFTLFDGRKASATHVYTKIDDDTYTFSSENRDIDGVLLPNIGPFKAVRKR